MRRERSLHRLSAEGAVPNAETIPPEFSIWISGAHHTLLRTSTQRAGLEGIGSLLCRWYPQRSKQPPKSGIGVCVRWRNASRPLTASRHAPTASASWEADTGIRPGEPAILPEPSFVTSHNAVSGEEPPQVRLPFAAQRPVNCSSLSGYRAPSSLIFDEALSISRRSSGVSSTEAAPRFSSRR
jgi:hypothetical protein